jgi:hypothetical protein
MCRIGSIQLDIARIRPWRQDNYGGGSEGHYKFPSIEYDRLMHPGQSIEFNFDRLINTDLNL